MRTYVCLELAKLLAFLALGYWGLRQYDSWFVALLCGMLGSGIVAVTYRLGAR